MIKEVIIALIQKDIRELDVIAQGLYETEIPSPTIIQLASSKAQEIVNNLQKLAELKIEELPTRVVIEEEIEAKPAEKDLEFELIDFETAEQSEKEDITEDIILHDSIENETVALKQDEQPTIEKLIIEAEEASSHFNTEEKEHPIITEDKPLEKNIVPEKIVPQKKVTVETVGKPKQNSFANAIANKKITDIKQAISIGNRFRFQRELFGNNADKMNETLTELNNFTRIEDAYQYLTSNFDWKKENETVEDFLNLVNRLFV